MGRIKTKWSSSPSNRKLWMTEVRSNTTQTAKPPACDHRRLCLRPLNLTVPLIPHHTASAGLSSWLSFGWLCSPTREAGAPTTAFLRLGFSLCAQAPAARRYSPQIRCALLREAPEIKYGHWGSQDESDSGSRL